MMDQKKYSSMIPHIILRQKDSCFTFKKEIKNKHVYIHTSPSKNNIIYTVYVASLIRLYHPRAIIAYLQQNLLYTVLGKILSLDARPKIIAGQDNILTLINKWPFTEKVFPTWLLTITYQYPIIIITQTEYAKYDLVHNYNIDPNKISVIPNWNIQPAYMQKKTIDCIYCGRFEKQKRLDRLIDVFADVQKHIPGFQALLIGEGKEKDMIVQRIARHNLRKNIKILPPTHTVKAYIAKSKLFTMTSEFEGHPMVLLEAMSAQTIPVILKYPGVDEYIRHKKTGYIENTISAMAKRVIDLLTYKSTMIIVGKQAKKEVLKKYNKKLIEKTLSYL